MADIKVGKLLQTESVHRFPGQRGHGYTVYLPVEVVEGLMKTYSSSVKASRGVDMRIQDYVQAVVYSFLDERIPGWREKDY